MDPFVRRLVQRLFEPGSGLSRNRHFHTFDNPEGKQALRVSKRLRALARDIAACRAEGGTPSVMREGNATGGVTVAVALARLKSKRTTRLPEDEFELLLQLPEVRAALGSS
jgi:hypothetical protein